MDKQFVKKMCLKNHILFSANLVEDENQLEKNTNLIVEALQTTIAKKGPVHINVPFNEPLYETVDDLKEFNFSNVIANEVKQSVNYQKLSEIWNSSSKKMILVGNNFPDDELQKVLRNFTNDESVLILTETTSNLYHPKFINSIDKLIAPLTESEFLALQPDVLVTLGGMVISKKIKQFLRKYQPKHHWHVDALKTDGYLSLFIGIYTRKTNQFFTGN